MSFWYDFSLSLSFHPVLSLIVLSDALEIEADVGALLLQIDRKGDFYENDNVVFPHQDGPAYLHSNTILDGELVTDTDPRTGKVSHNFLLDFSIGWDTNSIGVVTSIT